MSRKFMILMLVVFGGLLYITSYALRKHTEPPAPPTADQLAKQKEAQEDEMRVRKEAEKARYLQMEQRNKAAGKTTSKGAPPPPGVMNLPVPPTAEPKRGRGPSDTDIRADWYKDRKPGVKGVEEEIALRQKNARPAPTPTMAPPQGSVMPPAHGPGDGHGH
jgi:hypothetical protein